jgi:uncharacterized protein DUF4345
MSKLEQHALRATICVACAVPICAGAAGVLLGPRMVPMAAAGTADLDSHFRYLSGLLLAIGLGFASTVPRIESQGTRFLLLTCVVVLGGIGRAISLLAIGVPSPAMLAAFGMELIVTPGLALWQRRVAAQGSDHAAREFALIPKPGIGYSRRAKSFEDQDRGQRRAGTCPTASNRSVIR